MKKEETPDNKSFVGLIENTLKTWPTKRII